MSTPETPDAGAKLEPLEAKVPEQTEGPLEGLQPDATLESGNPETSPEDLEPLVASEPLEPVEPMEFLAPKTMLQVRELKKTFGKKTAVRSVSFSMERGEVVGLLGPNGAGKTTVFYMIAGFHTPSAGGIFLGESEITRLPMYLRARAGISYLPQEASVFRKLSVEDNVMAILEMRPNLTKAQRIHLRDRLLDELGITHLRKQAAYTLSGGERRRTEIARALAIEPQFLLLDEPFAGIDPIAVFEIKKIIRLLADKGIGVLITDHNVRDTLEITDRAYIINLGEILTQGSREQILADEMARKIYLGEHFRM